MREYMIRLLVRTNDTEPGDVRHGERPYYDDQEMPGMIRDWFDSGLEDRDDGPVITWFEARMKPTPENHEHAFLLPARDDDTCTAYAACTVTWSEEKERRSG